MSTATQRARTGNRRAIAQTPITTNERRRDMQHVTQERESKRGSHQATREVLGWTHIDQPGFYVNRATGQGFRVTPELLVPGASPALSFLGAERDRFVLISDDPYLPVTAAKLLCADNDISPNF
jgi:hypothetical protein